VAEAARASCIHSLGRRELVDAELHSMQIFKRTWEGARNIVVNLLAVAPADLRCNFVTAVGLAIHSNGLSFAETKPQSVVALDLLEFN
jgi:hypothetical protein